MCFWVNWKHFYLDWAVDNFRILSFWKGFCGRGLHLTNGKCNKFICAVNNVVMLSIRFNPYKYSIFAHVFFHQINVRFRLIFFPFRTCLRSQKKMKLNRIVYLMGQTEVQTILNEHFYHCSVWFSFISLGWWFSSSLYMFYIFIFLWCIVLN